MAEEAEETWGDGPCQQVGVREREDSSVRKGDCGGAIEWKGLELCMRRGWKIVKGRGNPGRKWEFREVIKSRLTGLKRASSERTGDSG